MSKVQGYINKDGKPYAGAYVALEGKSKPHPHTHTDMHGYYAFLNVPDAAYAVVVEGTKAEVKVEGKDVDVKPIDKTAPATKGKA